MVKNRRTARDRRPSFDALEVLNLLSGTVSPSTPPPSQPPSQSPPTTPPDDNYNEVAIYDGSDKGGEHIAGGADFEEAADDHDTSINVTSWDDTMAKLTEYVRDHGRIDYLAIFDHGTAPSNTQQVGNERLTPEKAAQLQPLMAPEAEILLSGCHVGDNSNYCNSIATATGSTVEANTDLVQYSDRWWWFWDYRGEGEWLTFTGKPKPQEAFTMDGKK